MFKLFHLVVGEDLYRHSLLSNPIDLSIKYLKWTITHVQFGFNQISSFWDGLLFFTCPAAVVILEFRWTKIKLFKRVKYDIFLQNNIFIPCVVSDKILKLQHQKELVVEAMLNFWIKWKTCNVENHPCNTMFGSNWSCG